MMKSRITRIMIALVAAAALAFLLIVLYNNVSEDSGTKRILQMLGGDFPAGIIQAVTFFVFIFGVLELWHIDHNITVESDAYSFKLLPEQEQFVLSPNDVNQIKLSAIEREKYRKYQMTDLIKKACTKYRANKSTSEALGIVSSQAKLNLANSESEQSIVRFCAWAIPSIGFIGTILGIAQSLGAADKVSEDISIVTSKLNIAFDTTLVSLILSIILMLYFHVVQEKVEKFHTRLEEYVIENLINRIYKH